MLIYTNLPAFMTYSTTASLSSKPAWSDARMMVWLGMIFIEI